MKPERRRCVLLAVVLVSIPSCIEDTASNGNDNNHSVPFCGDGQRLGAEACDDGNAVSGDGCSTTCAVEPGWDCSGDVCVAVCGDGLAVGPEPCDGTDLRGQTCESLDEAEGSLTCSTLCTWDLGGCTGPAICGDGELQAGEECDEGEQNSDTVADACRTDCLQALCGDRVRDGTEACDDGNGSNGDGCSSSCALEPGWTCQGTMPTFCWNGTFIQIPAGSFAMGSPESEGGRTDDEPLHQVTLTRSFEIYSTEVTQAEYEWVMGYNPSLHSDCPTCPVEQVSWYEAAAFCNALSITAGLDGCYQCVGTAPDVDCAPVEIYASPHECPGFRLPTEAEWEYAARAETTTGTYQGNNWLWQCQQPNDILDPIAWFCGNSGGVSHPSGSLAPNAWGLFDVLGNAWEWVQDWSAAYVGDATDPWGPATGEDRVVRGGHFDSEPGSIRAANRGGSTALEIGPDLGFRPARSR